jgi:hypothetical protein
MAAAGQPHCKSIAKDGDPIDRWAVTVGGDQNPHGASSPQDSDDLHLTAHTEAWYYMIEAGECLPQAQFAQPTHAMELVCDQALCHLSLAEAQRLADRLEEEQALAERALALAHAYQPWR